MSSHVTIYKALFHIDNKYHFMVGLVIGSITSSGLILGYYHYNKSNVGRESIDDIIHQFNTENSRSTSNNNDYIYDDNDKDKHSAVTRIEEAKEFIHSGYRMLRWIIDYRLNRIDRLPVISKVEPNYLSKYIPAKAPIEPETWDQIFEDIDTAIVPGLTNWESSANFFAYFKPHSSYPAVIGELMCAGLNVMGFDWIASPACTELEVTVLDWLADLLNLPPKFFNLSPGPGGSVIQGSAGEAAIVAFLAAIVRVQIQHASLLATEGVSLINTSRENLVVFASDQAHAIIKKACMVLGIGHCRLIPTSSSYGPYALHPDELETAILNERAKGRVPLVVVATTGTTSSCAFDPLPQIGAIAAKYGCWFHIDAAYGGAYACLPELSKYFNGLECVDSFVVNCHKKLLCPFDLSALYVADRRPLLDALSLQPEYLRNSASESGAVVDYEHWQLPLGRRFRALKLWFVMRRYGKTGIVKHLRTSLSHSQYFASLLLSEKIPGSESAMFEMVVPASLSLVCFRLAEGSEHEQKLLLQNTKATGKCFIIHTKLEEKMVLRFACGGIEQTQKEIWQAYQVIRSEALKIIERRNAPVEFLTVQQIEVKFGVNLVCSSMECDCQFLKEINMSDYIDFGQDATVASFSVNSEDASVFRAMACYVRCFLGKSHPMVGREGPVCPFVPAALRYDSIRIAVLRSTFCATRDEIARLVTNMISTYQSLMPNTAPRAAYKAIILTFPDVTLEQAPDLIDGVQKELKVSFVEKGLMLGEFHLQNRACGLRNSQFFPLRTPFPSLAIRTMVPSDIVFLTPSDSTVEERRIMLNSYIGKFSGDPENEKFVSTARSLIDAL